MIDAIVSPESLDTPGERAEIRSRGGWARARSPVIVHLWRKGGSIMTPTQLVWRLDVPSLMMRRLCRDFSGLSAETIERCVTDVRLRGRHLGVDLTPQLVELVAREHLTSMVKSEPPSGRRAEARSGE
jgi:hypothetical protein